MFTVAKQTAICYMYWGSVCTSDKLEKIKRPQGHDLTAVCWQGAVHVVQLMMQSLDLFYHSTTVAYIFIA